MTASENRLWDELRKLKLNIRRQAPIGRYVADFVHHGSRLVIEVDGARHALPESQLHDAERDGWFRSQGYRVWRVSDVLAFGAPQRLAEEASQLIRRPRSAPPAWAADRIGAEVPEASVAGSPPSPTLPPSRGKGER